MASQKPIWLWIDPSRSCNLACRFCYSKESHTAEHMSLSLFRTILGSTVESDRYVVQKLHLNWRGDPLMNPQMPDLLAELESRQPYFPYEFHTNGTLITPNLASQLTAAMKTGRLYVSIDGGTEAGHDFNRGRGTFRSALNGLRLLLEARGDSGVPKVCLFQLQMGDPEGSYDPEFVELANRVDDWVRVDPVNPHSGQRVRVRPRRSLPMAEEGEIANPVGALPAVRPQARWWTLELPADSRIPSGPCFWAGNAFFVAPSGDVSVCLLSRTPDGILGNVEKDPFDTIVTAGERLRSEIERNGRAMTAHCRLCRMAEGVPIVDIERQPEGWSPARRGGTRDETKCEERCQ